MSDEQKNEVTVVGEGADDLFNALTTVGQEAGADVGMSEEEFDGVSAGNDYYPYVRLYTSASEAVKEGKIGQNSFCACQGKDKVQEIGQELDVLVYALRPKAMQISTDILTSYNQSSALFKEIVAESNVKESGASYGVEFLLWVNGLEKFVTLFMNSKTHRREAPNIRAVFEEWRNKKRDLPDCTLGHHLIKTPKFSWTAIEVRACTTQFENRPDNATVVEAVKKFMAQDGTKEPERVEGTEGTGRAV